MGVIPDTTKMPSSKFVFPKNGDASLVENTPFTIRMAIGNLATGNFVNAASNYYAAPQQTDASGSLIGHSHVVIQQIPSLDSTVPLDPNVFAFFKGLNGVAINGVLTTSVDKGLPTGFYRLTSINTAAVSLFASYLWYHENSSDYKVQNHQPALVAVAQHGSLDDGVYVSPSLFCSNSILTDSTVYCQSHGCS